MPAVKNNPTSSSEAFNARSRHMSLSFSPVGPAEPIDAEKVCPAHIDQALSTVRNWFVSGRVRFIMELEWSQQPWRNAAPQTPRNFIHPPWKPERSHWVDRLGKDHGQVNHT
jgi:hypothetical protein